ncbi:MFS transporter [Corynebacterium pseudokroppenstedtii]|uniref:MFS transporter n=1 Tax=Corynebacterium pseudokroppenstedtii TaxID=2804917 RepID=A0AAU0PZM0_9CORY|nr:MFS transporter [Corynebacterium pseudokroppenstedtii]MDU7503686.1 MFS transporter [Corynebacterium kroppenstedtii]MBY0790569.1 MFS transporter [Corynebacterium pseudokroppenstedtii]MCF6792890.1 MFS transporter [Corynebacterium pseudokroppenstedtii]MCF8702319.1 MFS transporter [Corynebacterium pseudokroppenstedtii]MCG2635540.1 MFS transporter [Corynebacterium pseudokroppenstedtii]
MVTTPDGGADSAPVSGAPRTHVSFVTKSAVVLLGMTALLNLYSTQPILGDIAAWAHIPTTDAAWTISTTTAGVAITAPFAGMLSDRVGRRRVIVVAVATMAVLTAAALTSWSYPALLAFRCAQGMCCPFVFAVVVAYIGEEYEPSTASTLNALYVAGTALGGFLGRMVAAILSDWTGSWRLSFLGNAVILAVTLAVTYWGLPPERQFIRTVDRGVGGFFVNAGRLLRKPRIVMTVLVGFALLFQQVASFTFASLALECPPFSLSTSTIGLIFVVFLIPTVTTPRFGALMDRWGPRWAFVASQSVSVGGLVLTLVPTIPTMIVGLALSCVGVFAGQAAGTLMVGRLATGARSTGVGLYLTGYYVGGAFGGVAPISFYSTAGWTAVVVLVLGVVLCAGVMGWWAWRPLGSQAHDPQ